MCAEPTKNINEGKIKVILLTFILLTWQLLKFIFRGGPLQPHPDMYFLIKEHAQLKSHPRQSPPDSLLWWGPSVQEGNLAEVTEALHRGMTLDSNLFGKMLVTGEAAGGWVAGTG